MKFYELPSNMNALLEKETTRFFVRVCFALSDGSFLFVKDSDIISCVINSYKSAEGGTVNIGELVLDNTSGIYSVEYNSEYTSDLNVLIYYAFGNSENSFLRFNLFADKNGFQCEQTGQKEKITKIKLVDLSEKLNDSKLQNNWTDSQVLVDKVVCDKTQVENSLVHLLAKRAGIDSSRINAANLPFRIPYVKIDTTAWKELCALARAYNACVECGKDLLLSFTESPYDMENVFNDESGFFLNESNITHYRYFNKSENYANNIRLKYTRYVETERQELWTYSDSPVWYDENMQACYPFTDDSRNIISNRNYEALYTAKNSEGLNRNVVYAKDISNVEEFAAGIVTSDNKQFEICKYDITTHPDKAIIQLGRNNQLIALYKASIYGKAVISETNFCVYVKDEKAIEKYGTLSKNVSSKYLSDDEIDGVPFYKKRAEDLLTECKKFSKGYYVTTYLPLIHARVDAFMDLRVYEGGKIQKVKIEEVTFRYKKDCAFSSEFFVKTV